MPQPVFLPPEDNTPQLAEKRLDPTTTTLTVVGARAVKQVIVIRKDLHMQRGKEIAQGAHAAMAWLSRRMVHSELNAVLHFTEAEQQWLLTSFRKVTLQVNSESELTRIYDLAEDALLEVHMITDSGLTVFHGTPTITCLAIGPDFDDRIDPITQGLRLY